MSDKITFMIIALFAVIGFGFIVFVLPVLLNHDCNKENTSIIIIQKDSTIKKLNIEMNDEVQKALNANDSVAVKQFMELVTK